MSVDMPIMGQALDRDIFHRYLARHARHNGLVTINEIQVAKQLQCCRDSVLNMIRDLEADGRVRRYKRRGPKGLLLVVHDSPARG